MNLFSLSKAVIKRAVRLTMIGMKRGPTLSRFAMYDDISKLFQPNGGHALSISGSEMLCRVLRMNEITTADYPEHDIRHLDFNDETFDYVVSDQVLEHVEGDPFAAIEETRRVLKPGGIAVHTTCLIHPIHNLNGEISDLWRFTPQGLAYLSRNFSEVIATGGWGNQFVPIIDWIGLRFDPVPLAEWHPFHKLAVHNDPRWPMVTWVVVKK